MKSNTAITRAARLALAVMMCVVACAEARAEFEMDWSASTTVNLGTGKFAPYYIASNNAGLNTQPFGVMERGAIGRELSTATRFSYGFGADLVAQWASNTGYTRYDAATATFSSVGRHPAYFNIQQLWGAVKWRGIFLFAGMKENDRSLFDSPLNSGDITWSNNARPIPQVRAGFIDFQNIPFTQGWVQIQCEFAYGKFFDNKWLENHFNYYDSFLTTDVWYHYKRCYFRTNPDAPFSVTVGMQHAAQFAGHYRHYRDGVETSAHNFPVRFRDFIDVFVQKRGSQASGSGGDQAYYNGNHLGSWDLKARYRFRNGSELTAYFQWPWEDGSGIGKLNGWDGVWGLQYKFAQAGIVEEVVAEYIDFTNQSGPIHWAPGDHPGTTITGSATGADDYYNNYFYDGWQNYGMSIGTPFIKSPLYNRDGYLRFQDNRVRGFHCGVRGTLPADIGYRVLFSYRTSWGTPMTPRPDKLHDTSMLVEGVYRFPKIAGMSMKGQVAFDFGKLYGNNFGFLVSLCYDGKLTF